MTQFGESRKQIEDFLKRLLAPIDKEASLKFCLPGNDEEAASLIANILSQISQFFYAQPAALRGIKCNTAWGTADYFSEFHKFWEEHHEFVLGVSVNEAQCKKVAERLETSYNPFSPSSVFDTYQLTPQQIANTRLFTAIQDFGFGLKRDFFALAQEQPYLFEPTEVIRHPNYARQQLEYLGVADYQPDKRMEWASRCAEWLVANYDGEAFNLGGKHSYNAVEIRNALVEATVGMNEKKADMFMRDMQELGVWELKQFEEVSVASDMNTMRIALRLGIVSTRIPLLSSFLDVFCYQYGVIDRATASSWRRVWELWCQIPNNHSPTSPAYIDFLIYNMGRNCCKLSKRRCEEQCTVLQRQRCVLNKLALPDCGGWCIFKGLCGEETRKLNPPKSISIFGRYGWTTAYSDDGGGLGLRCS